MTNTSFLNFSQNYRHVLIWLAIYASMIVLSSHHLGWASAWLLATVTMLPMVVCATIMLHLILPRLLQRHLFWYVVCTMLLLTVLDTGAVWFDNWTYEILGQYLRVESDRPSPRSSTPEKINAAILHGKYVLLLLCTIATQTVDYLLTQRRQEAEAFHEQQMQDQLKYLRAQINPHFLFNALNCIYTLTMIQDDKAPDSVLKLSEMLRYIIDDCRADAVPLSKEVKYIRNYIDFQRIRMEHEPNLTLDVQITDANYTIPPMILQPIIENCFKHSRLVDDANAWIHIAIRQNESGLLFTSDNSKPTATQFSRQSAILGRKDEERTGIGLMNVQQRLAMLFGDKCSLKVIEDDTHYKTVLHI